MEKYKIKKISESTTMIMECVGPMALFGTMLVVGKEKAALIDSGIGVSGDLDQVVRTITDLPVIILHTHSDVDHVGGDSLFAESEIYLHPADLDEYRIQNSYEFRMRDIEIMVGHDPEWVENANRNMVVTAKGEPLPLHEGDVFDLGGIHLKVYSVPGHSMGSVCYLNKEENYIHLGDAICPVPWVWMDRCPSLEAYRANVLSFAASLKGDETLYCSHSMDALPNDICEKLSGICDDILAGKNTDDEKFELDLTTYNFDGKDVRTHNFDYGFLVYNKNHLH